MPKIQINLPDEMNKKLKAQAKENFRSLTSQVLYILNVAVSAPVQVPAQPTQPVPVQPAQPHIEAPEEIREEINVHF